MDNFVPDGEMDFFEKLAHTAKESGDSLILKIIENAKEGDTSSLKILEKALNESRYAQAEKLKITDEQYRKIICLAADRVRGIRFTPSS